MQNQRDIGPIPQSYGILVYECVYISNDQFHQ